MFGFVSYRCRARVLLAAAGAFTFTTAAHGGLITGYATGSGENTSSLVIDFAYLDGDAYLFEYSYDGTATGEDMLLALNEAGPLTVGYQVFDFGGRSIFVDGFDYDGINAFPSFEGDSGENWSYWITDDAEAPFASTGLGPSGRTLQDGSVDGWAVNISEFNTKGLEPTSNAPTPVPEPTSAALLALAGGALLRRRRRSA